jgi:2-succinyl-5-enolpyruvyl-6-hydroxy-3-cyclohexene-1-carboxylate synthase
MRRHQHIAELGPLLGSFGICHVIVCPGSRNAPLTQLFTSQEGFSCYSIVDERSAAYVALGMARELQEPVVVLTTSGTAVLNLAPAIAEAFYQGLPLVVITADRPPEKISQFNNQILDQELPFFAYSKGFYQPPLQPTHPDDLTQTMKQMERLVTSAVSFPAGPVHLNIPLEEPLYENLPPVLEDETYKPQIPNAENPVSRFEAVETNTKILVLAGMGPCKKDLKEGLSNLVSSCQAVVIAENITNISGEDFITQPELLLAGVQEGGKEALIPDLLISFGGQVVSKRLKLFLQNLPDLKHVEIKGDVPASLEQLAESVSGGGQPDSPKNFLESWKLEQERGRLLMQGKLLDLEYGNLWVFKTILSMAPTESVIHLGNSSTIRYSQILPHREDLSYYSNRGTSGIDGCVSSAVGAAMVSDQMHVLLVGDLSFVYDSNALWNKEFPDNLKIVVLNDKGGGIFRLLKGPSDMDFFEKFSVAHHPVSLDKLAKSYGRTAIKVGKMEELGGAVNTLFAPGSTLSVVEVDTSEQENSRIFKEFLDFKR